MRLVALSPRIQGIAKRPTRMNYEETIFPRREYTMGYAQNAHNLHIHKVSIDCSGPLENFGEFLDSDLRKMLSCTREFLPTVQRQKATRLLWQRTAPCIAKIHIFLAINALCGILFLRTANYVLFLQYYKKLIVGGTTTGTNT